MVAVQQDPSTEDMRFVLRPDFGGNWRQTVWLYLSLVATSMSLALVFATMGYWPVLPFAGLEMLALGAALYVSARRGAVREVVSLSGGEIVVEHGVRQPERRVSFDRYWSVVELSESRARWYPSRLFIRSGTRVVELGWFLHEDERRAFARELGELIGPMASAGGTARAGTEPAERA